jgi:hypothetical protein
VAVEQATRALAGLVTLHAKRYVGHEWRHAPLLVRAGAIVAVRPRYSEDGTPRGSEVLVAGDCWLQVTELPDEIAAALVGADGWPNEGIPA